MAQQDNDITKPVSTRAKTPRGVEHGPSGGQAPPAGEDFLMNDFSSQTKPPRNRTPKERGGGTPGDLSSPMSPMKGDNSNGRRRSR